MKIYLNRFPVRGPWGGGAHFVNAFHSLASKFGAAMVPAQSTNVTPDVVLAAGIDNDGTGISLEEAIMYKTTINPSVKIVFRVNENDARKGTVGVDRKIMKLAEHVDATVFVSTWLQDYFLQKGWSCQNNTVIYNGVDAELFKPGEKFNDGKTHIVTHHWSDNRNKGFDVYDWLDEWVGKHSDRYTFTYIGRSSTRFKNSKIVGPLSGKKLGDELGRYDVYVSASRFDPGPNHITESISCKIPTYVYKDGGGCVEFAGPDHVYNDVSELEKLLVDRSFSLNKTSFSSWDECVKQYIDFIKGV